MKYQEEYVTLNGVNFLCRFILFPREAPVMYGPAAGPGCCAQVDDLTVYLRDPVAHTMHDITDFMQPIVLEWIEDAILEGDY